MSTEEKKAKRKGLIRVIQGCLCPEINDYDYLYEGLPNELKNQVEISLRYFIWNAKFYKELNIFLCILSIVLPSLATFISCKPFGDNPTWVIPAITAVTAITSSLLALLKCSEKQKSCRESAESLKKEISKYYGKVEEYSDKEKAAKMLNVKVNEIIHSGNIKILILETNDNKE